MPWRTRAALALHFTALAVASSTSRLSVPVDSAGGYKLLVDGATWLTGLGTSFRADGEIFSTDDGSLSLLEMSDISGDVCRITHLFMESRSPDMSDISGIDVGGKYTGKKFTWSANGAVQRNSFATAVRVYDSHAVFQQFYPAGKSSCMRSFLCAC